jgi:peptidyl-tRNA hydrolase, PTH1 family
MQEKHTIKAIIGLGNPGPTHFFQRHNIGFRVIDALATKHTASPWQKKDNLEYTKIAINGSPVLLIKPQTFMNSSGAVIPYLSKQGIKAENILVIHDELEKPFGSLAIKFDGSHRGHNGLRSIIGICGPQFLRLRFGIGRPADKEDVPNYVLRQFDKTEVVDPHIDEAIKIIEDLF